MAPGSISRRPLSLTILINIYVMSISFWVYVSQGVQQPVVDSWNSEASQHHRLRRLLTTWTIWPLRLPPRPPPTSTLDSWPISATRTAPSSPNVPLQPSPPPPPSAPPPSAPPPLLPPLPPPPPPPQRSKPPPRKPPSPPPPKPSPPSPPSNPPPLLPPPPPPPQRSKPPPRKPPSPPPPKASPPSPPSNPAPLLPPPPPPPQRSKPPPRKPPLPPPPKPSPPSSPSNPPPLLPPPSPPSNPPPSPRPSPVTPRSPTGRRRPPYTPLPPGPSRPPSSPPRPPPPRFPPPSPPPPSLPPSPRPPLSPPPPASSSPPPHTPPPPPITSSITQDVFTLSTVAMAVDKCGETSSGTVELLQDLYAGPLPDYFEMASFGAMVMPKDPQINLVVPIGVTIGCSGWSLSMGLGWNSTPATIENIYGWGEAADTSAKRLGVDVEDFKRRIYLMPPSMGGLSVGTLNCPPNTYLVNRVASSVTASKAAIAKALVHELGHTLGLLHSMAYIDNDATLYAYGDGSCPMGRAGELMSHFNAPQSAALGWIRPQAVLTKQNLTAGVWRSFKITGLADSPVNSLQVFPRSWDADGWGAADSLFISYRHAVKGDAALPEPYRNRVQVHKWAPDAGGCASSVLLRNLDTTSFPVWPRAGSTLALDTSSPLLVVRVTAVDTVGGVATVKLCRAVQFGAETGSQCRDGLDNNCDGLVDNC